MGRKILISESEKKQILSLYYILNEQDPMSQYGGTYTREPLPSDWTGPTGTQIQRDSPQIYQANVQNLKSDEEKKMQDEANSLKIKYANRIPYTFYYKTENTIFKEWVEQKITSLDAPSYCEKNILPYTIDFFKKYFDYKSNPQIIEKIKTISEKNGTSSKLMLNDNYIKKTIDKLLNEYLPSITFDLDFEYNRKNPNTIAYVYPSKLDGLVHICAMSKLFVYGYKLGDISDWKETITHEIGHLIDGYFASKKIYVHATDDGNSSLFSNKIVTYPHENINLNFLNLLDSDKEYVENPTEQFTRFKILFDILSPFGFKIDSTFEEFRESLYKSFKNDYLAIGPDGCEVSFVNDVIKLNCEDGTKIIKTEKDFLNVWSYYEGSSDYMNNSSLYWLFRYYTTIKFIQSSSVERLQPDYEINLRRMYDDFMNKYVMDGKIKSSDSASTPPNYPSA
jgi:hypothetical protein